MVVPKNKPPTLYNGPTGSAPSVTANEWSIVSLPAGVTLKTMPSLLAPPFVVVPYSTPLNGTRNVGWLPSLGFFPNGYSGLKLLTSGADTVSRENAVEIGGNAVGPECCEHADSTKQHKTATRRGRDRI